MNDFIRREDVIQEFIKTCSIEYVDINGVAIFYETIMKIINSIPSTKPERKWIPVTEALPENDDWVIVSIYDDDGDTSWQYTTPGFYVPYGKCWIVDNEYCKNVIAWMPLPKPYSEGE